jgi:phosphoenolpyruvate synthase/pyruvate phosphate dikinase
MESKNIKIKMPKDLHIAWERDFSFLGCYLIARQHIFDLKKILGKGYPMCAFFYKSGQVKFYRSEADENKFNKYVADRFLNDKKFSNFALKRLTELTNQLKKFLAKEAKITKLNIEKFWNLVDEHFVYHLAVFWAADYLARQNLEGSNKKLIGALRKVRIYNERVLPNIEKWLVSKNSKCLFLTKSECENYIFKGVKLSLAELNRRKKGVFVYFASSQEVLLTGEKAIKQDKIFEKFYIARFSFKEKLLKGVRVSSGKIKGRVRLVKIFKDFNKIKSGEIVVVPMTRPDYNGYLKNAAAIIADEGSVLCHVAIIARELKIPAVVGTKIATRVLHNSDLVEVDAEKGIVNILN